jgi:hypothetical protein
MGLDIELETELSVELDIEELDIGASPVFRRHLAGN